MHLANPGALLLVLLLPVVIALVLRRRRTAAVQYSSLDVMRGFGPSWRVVLRPTTLLLRTACLVLLVIALARPQHALSEIRTSTEGIAVMLVVDRSSSMSETMNLDGQRLTRLDVVKRVLAEFVEGNKRDLPGRPDDLIGMVSFARYADTICPLVRAHDVLVGLAEQTKLVELRDEDGTAIGDAIALAAARLRTVEEELERRADDTGDAPHPGDDYTIKGKVIIVLTDGMNNAGQRSPMQAARIAADWGIRIYTIGIGESGTRSIFDFTLRNQVDEQTLRAVANATGGMYRLATDADSLRAIYKEINQLEKTEIQSVEYAQYDEAFAPWAEAALAVLLVEMLLTTLLMRRMP
ncbi:MAG: VWA domain-containing protein [Phycisphaerales bacterium]|nr:VWA domain-containing protein [Phycisphaerales bacterium]